MVHFAEWLLLQERSLVDSNAVDSYERAFQQGLERLIARTRDPNLRQAFEGMRQFRFCNYIVGAIIRNGIPEQYDPEDCLQRICFHMLSPVGERGLPRQGLFDLDPNRSYDLRQGNPLEARFKTYLYHDLRSIAGGQIPALRRNPRPGSLSIGYGHDPGTVSPDEIPGRPTSGEQEMLDDIMVLLRQHSTPQMPLAAIFQSIMAGEGTRVQRNRFGWTKADQGRKMIVQVIGQYGRQTQNWQLSRLLDRLQHPVAPRPVATRRPAQPFKLPTPKYPPDEQDYRSIVQVLERNGRAASMAVFGSQRSRWLERAPRDPSSPHPNRLADVLSRMVADGVLAKQGARYVPGRNYARYLDSPEPVAVA